MSYSGLSLQITLDFDIAKSDYQRSYQRHPVEVGKSVFVAGTLGSGSWPFEREVGGLFAGSDAHSRGSCVHHLG